MDAPTLALKPEMSEIQGETAFAFLALAKKLQAQGRRIISFGIGQPDFPTPRNIVEAAKRALDEGFTGYTETAGIPELREAIAEYLHRKHGGDVDPDEVVVTTGAKTAIFIAIASFVRPGDEVIVPEPSYYAYSMAAKFFGGRPVFVPMKFEPGYGFRLDVDKIEEAVTDKTRMIVINNPHNPTGSIFDADQIDRLYELARRRGIILLFDEIYDNFVYEEGKFKSVISYPDWRDYVLYVNGFSKTFSMTGWRLGYLVARKEIIPKIIDLAVTVYSCPPSIAQKAGVEALRGDWSEVYRMIETFRRRAKLLYDILKDAHGIEPYKPHGAFYMFPRVSQLLADAGLDVEQLSHKLLYDYGVVVLPGTSFPDKIGKDFIRLSFATSTKDIEEGARIIVRASRELAGKA